MVRAIQARRQRGVALLTAVLVVALVTVAAVAMASRQQVDIRRTANILQSEQALAYGEGIENWTRELLRRDAKDSKKDSLGEDWAQVLPPIPVDGGQLSGQLVDAEGRFNLNSLYKAGAVDTLARERFRRLLNALGLNPDLASAVIDWIDPDLDVTFPGGAEDTAYLAETVPYRAANRPFVSVTELRLVSGVTPEIYAKLAPHLSALPTDNGINVNTADKAVLMSLADGINEAVADSLIEDRGDKGFDDVSQFLQDRTLTGAGIAVDGKELTVTSNYFMLEATVLMGQVVYSFRSLLHRDPNGSTYVMARSRGEY